MTVWRMHPTGLAINTQSSPSYGDLALEYCDPKASEDKKSLLGQIRE